MTALPSVLVALVLGSASLVVPAMAGTNTGNSHAADEFVDRQTQAALALDADPEQGGRLFATHCTRCHGAQGFGDAEHRIPVLAGQRFAYLVRQLADFAAAERDSATMHRVVSEPALRSPQAWVNVAAFLNSAPTIPAATPGSGTDLELGGSIFQEHCVSCHHTDAAGDDAGFVPSLRGQHFAYLRAQMHRIADDHRHNVARNLERFLTSFDNREIDATADYLSRLRGAGADHKKMRDNGVVVD